jgi:ribosome-binding protein aMBF1 (putative translation factor)
MAGTKGNNLVIPTKRTERNPAAVYADINEAWVTLADLYQELGRAISEERRARAMTQTRLAKALNITRGMVARYEIGDRWKHDPVAIEEIVRFLDTH